ncbi:MAG TPA: MazG nucleotide pyrophosphohydrolase domain-containing protein [Candidatus Saccharimonadales bacterium]|nr:MazG nucleotide pyrophosphohydrolase domain-containing protein [Candidatus Saccharimonadales bacterium]
MPTLPNRPTLADYQQLVKKLIVERSYNEETVPEVMMLLTEEVGELAKAIRKLNGQKTHQDSRAHDAAEELADCFWLLIDLSNRLDIDLEKAFRAKEAKNQRRKLV